MTIKQIAELTGKEKRTIQRWIAKAREKSVIAPMTKSRSENEEYK